MNIFISTVHFMYTQLQWNNDIDAETEGKLK